MDPLSQAVLGASAALASKKAKVPKGQSYFRDALIVGSLAGLAPDADVFITSAHDSLLQIEFHRHFTHSIFVAPFIGLLVASILWWPYKKKYDFSQLSLWAILGALTHGILDASTSYGTHLFWPFTPSRESWSIVSIIDPFFTLPLLVLCILAVKYQRHRFAYLGLAWALLYLSFGVFQHQRAKNFYYQYLVQQRPERKDFEILVKPTLGNLWLWRGIADYEDFYKVDGIRLGTFKDSIIYPGKTLPYINRDLSPWDEYSEDSVVIRDLKRFNFFSEDLIYQLPQNHLLVGDLRYSLLPHSIEPLWVVELKEGQAPNQHLKFYHTRNVTVEKRELFMKMIFGENIKQEELDAF